MKKTTNKENFQKLLTFIPEEETERVEFVTKQIETLDKRAEARRTANAEKNTENKELAYKVFDTADNVVVVNPERELLVEFNGRKFRILLSAPRT